MPKIEFERFDKLLKFLPKSKIKAAEGLEEGKYRFFKSGNDQSEFINNAIFQGESLIIGDGGNANINYYDGKFSASDHCYVIQKKEDKEIDIRYIYYYLKSNIKILEDGFKGAGLKNISKKYISNIKIPIFSIDTQKKVANLLSQIEKVITKREKSIELLDQLIKSTFLDMFGDPVVNPKKWETIKFELLCKNMMGGGTPKTSISHYFTGDIPWITPKDMKKLYISDSKISITEEAIENSSAKKIPPDSFLMVIRSGILKKYLPIAINKVEVTVNQDMKAFVFNDKTNNDFIMYFFKNYQKFLLEKVRSVTADNLKFSDIKNIDTILPPKDLQDKFANTVIKIENTKKIYQKSLDELNQLFGSVSQKAFKGELDLSDIQSISNQTTNQSKVNQKKKQIVKNRIKVNSLSRKRTATKSDFTKEYFENILSRYTIKSGRNIYSFKNKRRFERFLKKLFNKGMSFYLLFELCESYKILIPYDDKFKKENDDFTYKEVIYDFLKDKEVIQRIREYKKDGKLKREMILRARK